MRIKNNRGFTLIELIVVIAIMASILTLAIGSLNGISKKKKDEAKKKIEDQVIVAAKEYFSSNEYLFEALNDIGGDATSKICINKLINDDYINSLTDPTTNKKISGQDYVEITKLSKNKFSYIYKVDDGTCNNSAIVTIEYNKSGTEEPNTEIKYYDEEDNEITANDKWFNIESFSKNSSDGGETKENSNITKPIKICVEEKNNKISLTSVSIFNDTITKSNDKYCKTINEDYNKENREIVINYSNNSNVKSNKITDDNGKDTVAPTVDVYPTANFTDPKIEKFSLRKKETLYEGMFNGLNDITKPIAKIAYQLSTIESEYMDVYTYDATSGIKEEKFDGNDTNYVEKQVDSEVFNVDENKYSLGVERILSVFDNANNYTNVILNKPKYETCERKTDTESLKEEGSCNCVTGKKNIDNYNITRDIFDRDYICSSEYVNSNEEDCECEKLPTITVKIYKNSESNTASGNAIITKSFTGNNVNNKIDVNSLNWLNKKKFPYGIYIEYYMDINVAKTGWYWNKAFLDKANASKEDYKWNNTSTGFSSGGMNIKQNINGGTKIGYPLSADGVRKGVLSAENSTGTTLVYLNANIDKTPPTIENVTYPTYYESKYCSGKKSVYTEFKVTDSISKVYQVNHFMDDKPTYDPTIEKIVIGNSLYSVKEGKANNTAAQAEIYMNYFNPSTTSITNGFNIKRAWAYGTLSSARNVKCGTKATNTPNSNWKLYCNYVSAKDAAGNVTSAKLCANGSETRTTNK